MTIGQLAGVPLQGTTDASGAVFRLHRAPRASAGPLEPVEIGGWTTTLTKDREFVVVYGGTQRTIDVVRSEALIRANDALDYLSATGVADAAISDADDQTIVWAVDGTQATMRVIVTNPVSLPTFHATATVTDASGKVVPPPPPPTPVVVDSMRFLRMSRTTDGLFDAYRYAFLALESLLHEVHPQARGVGEGAWLQDALRAADPLVPVAQLAPAGETDPVGWVYTNVYKDLRSGLMHAKRDYHLPADEARRAEIARSLGSITPYYLDLLRKLHGIESGGGQWADFVWQEMSEQVLGLLRPAGSTDTTPISLSDDRSFAPGGGTTMELPASGVQHPTPALSYILGSSDGEAVRALGPLGRIGAVMDADVPGAYSDLPFGLEVGAAVTRFEVLVGMRNARPGRVRTHFTM